MFEVTVMCYE